MKKVFLVFAMGVSILFAAFGAEKNANVKSAQGTGPTEEKARSEALSNLAFYFYSNVKSTVESEQKMTQEKDRTEKSAAIEKKTLISTDIPLLGIEYKIETNGQKGKAKEYTATAIMKAETALPLYHSELTKLAQSINIKLKELSSLKGEKKEKAYIELAADYAQYQKLDFVAGVFNSSSPVKPDLSPEEFSAQYKAYCRDVNSLEKAAQIIAESVSSNQDIFVYAPLYDGDGTATQFSRTLAQFITSRLGSKAALEKSRAIYNLNGVYYLVPGAKNGSKDDMIVSFFLCKNDGSVVSSCPQIRLSYDVYAQYAYMPAGYSLTQEIAKGNVADPSFTVSLRINGDLRPQYFKKGDSLCIEARVTSPCYIYVVGHVFNERGEEFSYLFPLEPYADEKEMFIRRISASEVNKWVVLNPVIEGEAANIEIIPPYGEECLQIFAVTIDSLDEVRSLIPDYRESDDFYIVTGSPSAVSEKTRALAVKKVSDKTKKTMHKAEAEISYSTYSK